VNNARKLLEEFIAFSFRDPVVAAEMFTADGHLVNALADWEARGVVFVSLKDNVDLSTPRGRLMFQIIGAMAEFERSLITERVRAGLRNAQAKGRPPGVLGLPWTFGA